MPQKVNREDRAAAFQRRKAAAPARIDAIMAMEDEQARNTSFTEYLAARGLDKVGTYDEDYSLESYDSQVARIEMSLLYEFYISNHWFTLIKSKHPSVAHINDPLTPPLDFTIDLQVTIARLKSFMQYKYFLSKPKRADSDKITAPTVASWARRLVDVILDELIQSGMPSGEISKLLGGRSRRGIYFELRRASNAIISQNELPVRARPAAVYGREEVALIQDDIVEDIVKGGDWFLSMSELVVMTMAFTIGIRGGSICATSIHDSERGGMDAEDFKFERNLSTEINSYATLVHIRHLKGYQIPSDRSFVDFTVLPIKLVQNLHLDISSYLLPYLMAQGHLREAGGGKVLRTIEDLATSKASVLEGFGGPLIPSTTGHKYYSASAMTQAIRRHAAKVGLPATGGIHNFRRDVARELAIIAGKDTARDVLNHQQQKDALNRHYTTGPGLLDIAGLRTGEAFTAEQQQLLQKSTRAHAQLHGLAAKAVAAMSTAEGEARADKQQSSSKIRKSRDANKDHGEMIRDALKFDPSLQGLSDKYSTTASQVDNATLGTDYRRSSLALLKGLQKKTPVLDTEKHHLIQSLMDTAAKIRKIITDSNEKLRHIKYRDRGAPKTAAPPTTAELLSANKKLQEKNNERAALSQRLARSAQALSDIEILQLPLDSLRDRPNAIAIAAQLRLPSEEADDEPATEVPLPAIEEGDTDGPVSLLDESLVISDCKVSATAAEEEATALARLARIGFFLRLRQGRQRFNALIEYTADACVCPLCSWSQSLAPAISSRGTVGVFFTLPPRDETKWAAHLRDRNKSVRSHMFKYHAQIIEHILLGGRVQPLAFTSPSTPVFLDRTPHRLDLYGGIQFRGDEMDVIKARWLAPVPSIINPKAPLEQKTAVQLLGATLTSTFKSATTVNATPSQRQSYNHMMRYDWQGPGPKAKNLPTGVRSLQQRMTAQGLDPITVAAPSKFHGKISHSSAQFPFDWSLAGGKRSVPSEGNSGTPSSKRARGQ
ncbi:unnamed protein product [Sympodiomycopsis kandeliae]